MPSGKRKEPTQITCLRCGETALWIGGRRKQFCSQTCGSGYRNGNKKRQPKEPGSYRTRQTKQSRQLKIDRGQCADCGLIITAHNVICIDWDHRDPSKKHFTISAVMGRVAWSLIEQEINKCDAVCRNCHALRTHYKKHHNTPPRQHQIKPNRGQHPKTIRYEQHATATHN